MKKIKFIFSLIIILLFLSIFTNNVYADNIGLNIDGVNIKIPNEMGKPLNKDNRILVPVRFITENLGFKVKWDESNKEAYLEKDDLIVTLPTNGSNPKVNGEDIVLDVLPIIINDRTYVPIRFISELSGKVVSFSNNTVYVNDTKIYISPNPYHFERRTIKVGNRNITANIVTIDTKDSRLKVEMGLANDTQNSTESFKSIINRKKPTIAVNGFFFDSYDGTNNTYGHLVNNFKTLNYEGFQPAYFVDKNNKSFIANPYDYDMSYDDVKHMVSVGPHLVKDNVDLAEAGYDMETGKGLSRAQRTAIGITKNKFLKIVTANGVSNPDMAKLMLAIGCTDAGNLDGGASSALYYNGRIITHPGRNLNNYVLFYLNK